MNGGRTGVGGGRQHGGDALRGGRQEDCGGAPPLGAEVVVNVNLHNRFRRCRSTAVGHGDNLSVGLPPPPRQCHKDVRLGEGVGEREGDGRGRGDARELLDDGGERAGQGGSGPLRRAPAQNMRAATTQSGRGRNDSLAFASRYRERHGPVVVEGEGVALQQLCPSSKVHSTVRSRPSERGRGAGIAAVDSNSGDCSSRGRVATPVLDLQSERDSQSSHGLLEV
mmetsp:Transcript_2370/g.5613  ORF Transcript_2370/g.5613 Transcript_2370/m.5613 type:complete len:224 (-) Transcript_2370:1317-1988(-)